jgi:hypothetical protein
LPDAGSGYVASLPLIGLFSIVTTIAARNTTNISIPQAIEERSFSVGLAVAAVIVFLLARFLAPGVPIPPWDSSLDLQLRP